MNSKRNRLTAMAMVLMLLVMPLTLTETAMAADKESRILSESGTSSNRQTVTIGYCGEEYTTFTLIMSGVCKALHEDGMLRMPPPVKFLRAQGCWEFIADNAHDNENVVFDRDAFFNITEMSEEERLEIVSKPQADLMIVMGSLAAKLFINSGYKGDYIVAGTNNAYSIGAVESASDSGSDNRCAAIYDDVYIKQVQSVCEMFEFERMGVVYENSPLAFEYSGISELRKQSQQKGFELIENNLNEPVTVDDYSEYLTAIKKLYQEMAQQVDVFYLTINQIRSEDLQDALKPFYDKKIPVISQQGSREVENGALFGISMTDEHNYGALLTDMITDYLSGQPIRYMSRVFRSSPKVSFNLSIAKKIDYPLDFKTMLTCDDIY